MLGPEPFGFAAIGIEGTDGFFAGPLASFSIAAIVAANSGFSGSGGGAVLGRSRCAGRWRRFLK